MWRECQRINSISGDSFGPGTSLECRNKQGMGHPRKSTMSQPFCLWSPKWKTFKGSHHCKFCFKINLRGSHCRDPKSEALIWVISEPTAIEREINSCTIKILLLHFFSCQTLKNDIASDPKRHLERELDLRTEKPN